jgi:uncharacterized repeat protein (TIGR04052 family)
VRCLLAVCAAACIASCSQWDLGVEIPFLATWQGQTIDCAGDGPTLTDLRFYVSDPQLIDADGRAHDMRFATEFRWQNDAVALIDLERGSGACSKGTGQMYDRLIGVARAGEYRGLRFTVGVPFRLNHADPLQAGPPLDEPDMHWPGAAGYRFLRAGVSTASDGFLIHGGSAGCEGPADTISVCRFPNRIEVILPEFVPGEHAIELDIAALVAGTNLDDGVPTKCSSRPSESSCVAPYAALGIDFASGKQNGLQRVFSARRHGGMNLNQ